MIARLAALHAAPDGKRRNERKKSLRTYRMHRVTHLSRMAAVSLAVYTMKNRSAFSLGRFIGWKPLGKAAGVHHRERGVFIGQRYVSVLKPKQSPRVLLADTAW